MNAKTLLYFIVSYNLGSINLAQDDANCDYLGTGLYEDIGCKAIYDLKKSCPDRYSCPTNKNDPNICYQGGNKYRKGEKIDIESQSCLGLNCSCKSGYKQGNIVCDQCPPIPTPRRGCYYTSKPFGCCSTEEYCDSEHQNPVTCEYNGQVFSEGYYFQPENTCVECYCSKGFNEKLEEPYCRNISCLSDIYHQRKIKKRCAPNYFVQQKKENYPLCCPINFICEEDIIKAIYIKRGAITEEGKCAFNGGYYNKDDSLNVSYARKITEMFATCSCRLPPLMTCIAPYPNYVVYYDDEEKKRNRNNVISKRKHTNNPK